MAVFNISPYKHQLNHLGEAIFTDIYNDIDLWLTDSNYTGTHYFNVVYCESLVRKKVNKLM